MNKPILQYASDQVNSSQIKDNDTIQITKMVASLYRKTKEAISLHEYQKNTKTKEKEEISSVTGKDIKDAMNREMVD